MYNTVGVMIWSRRSVCVCAIMLERVMVCWKITIQKCTRCRIMDRIEAGRVSNVFTILVATVT